MLRKKKNDEDKYVLRKPTKASGEISFVDEQPVQNLNENYVKLAEPDNDYSKRYSW